MISQNELNLFFEIQTQCVPDLSEFFGEKELCEIDLNNRKINSPKSVIIKKDHQAATIYFCLDRFYDYMDLSTTIGVIQYILPGEEEIRIYPIPAYDVYSLAEYNKMIIPWTFTDAMTKTEGEIEYSVRFFKITGETLDKLKFAYNLNTLPTKTQILYGLDADFSQVDEELSEILDSIESSEIVSKYEDLLRRIQENKIYWTIYN